MNRIINQRHGLGDILFIIPLVRLWQSRGDRVLFPICKEYLNIQKNFPDIEFADARTVKIDYNNRNRHQWKEWTVEPLCWADLHKPPPKNCMRAKYDMYGEDFMMWKQLTWKRDINCEDSLQQRFANYPAYNLISDRWGGLEQGQYRVPIHVDNGLPNVHLQYVEGYNLLDWTSIIMNATFIHTVGSSINYIMECVDLKAEEVHLYKRLPRERHFMFYDYLLTKRYLFHD